MLNLTQSTVLITGSEGGLGSEFVKEFDKLGATLILVDKENTSQFQHIHDYYRCDLSKKDQIIDTCKKIKQKYTKMDILINNAGIGLYKNIEDISYEDFEKSCYINFYAPFILTKELLNLLKNSNLAVIINIGSGCGVKPLPNRIEYNVAKFALRGMSLSLSLDLEKYNIKSIYFNLGSVLTNFGPISKEERIRRCKEEGKCYLQPGEVATFIINKLKEDLTEKEWTLYPQGYINALI